MPVSQQVCDGFMCLTAPHFCEATTSTFHVWGSAQKSSFVLCFCVGCRHGVFSEIRRIFFLKFSCFGVSSECSFAFVIGSPHSPLVLLVFLVCPLHPRVLGVAPKSCQSNVMSDSRDFPSSECFGFSFIQLPQWCQCFSFVWMHFLPSVHLLACGSQVLRWLYFISLAVIVFQFFLSPLFWLLPFLLPPLLKKWHLSLMLRCFITLCW